MECRFCGTVFYNSENGYTVATYTTDEPLPEKAQKENGQFVAVGYDRMHQRKREEVSPWRFFWKL